MGKPDVVKGVPETDREKRAARDVPREIDCERRNARDVPHGTGILLNTSENAIMQNPMCFFDSKRAGTHRKLRKTQNGCILMGKARNLSIGK